MSFRIHAIGLYFFSLILISLSSCEKEETTEQNLQKLALKIETLNGESGVGNLVITKQNGGTTQNSTIDFNTVQEIAIDLENDGIYIFEVDDPALGKIKMFATGETLPNYTIQNPFTLRFEHYKNQVVATFVVNSLSEPSSRVRFVDLTLTQAFESSLYHIDWGDGSEEVAESPKEIQSPNDKIEHHYASNGDYTITISTTDIEEVSGIGLQITGNGQGDRIQTLQLEEMPNLTYFSLGDNNLENIDSIIEEYPRLNHLSIRFGSLTSINLSQNPMLEVLIVNDDFDTRIEGLSTLTNLKFLGLTGVIEDLDLSAFPELYHLSIKGHKMNSLDVSKNTKLTTLLLQLNELEEIDLSANVSLETLYITNNNLTELDLSNNPEIKNLDLYANYIEELGLVRQDKLEFLNLSSVHIKQVAAPTSLDNILHVDLTNSRFLDEAELLDAIFKGQDNNPKMSGRIIFHELAVVLDRQIILLNELVETHDWNINIPE